MSKKKKSIPVEIDIVICSYGKADVAEKCLKSVVKYTKDPYRLILVDDGSEDYGRIQKLYRSIQEKRSNTIIIRHRKNLGFVKSANDGLKISKAPLVMLLNNDITILKEWQDQLYKIYHEKPSDGLIGPIGHTMLDPKRYKWSYKEDGDFAINNITFVSGSRMIIRREVIEKIGYFDEEFGVGYYEDNDFSIRAKLVGFNFNRWVIPSDHVKSATFEQLYKGNAKSMLLSSNRKYLLRKHREYLTTGKKPEKFNPYK